MQAGSCPRRLPEVRRLRGVSATSGLSRYVKDGSARAAVPVTPHDQKGLAGYGRPALFGNINGMCPYFKKVRG